MNKALLNLNNSITLYPIESVSDNNNDDNKGSINMNHRI